MQFLWSMLLFLVLLLCFVFIMRKMGAFSVLVKLKIVHEKCLNFDSIKLYEPCIDTRVKKLVNDLNPGVISHLSCMIVLPRVVFTKTVVVIGD